MTPPDYRSRLRLEGFVLAGLGLLGSAVLVLAVPASRQHLASTIIQLAIVAALLGVLGPRSVRSAVGGSEARDPANLGSGEPTPLWHIAAIVVGLTLLAGLAGWDAGLRVSGGCTLVGLCQAVLLAELVRREEDRTGRTYFRMAGSRILRGTRLGYLSAVTSAASPSGRGRSASAS